MLARIHFWNHTCTKSFLTFIRQKRHLFDKHENKWQGTTTTTYPQQKMSQFIDNTFLGHARSCSVRIITTNFFEIRALFSSSLLERVWLSLAIWSRKLHIIVFLVVGPSTCIPILMGSLLGECMFFFERIFLLLLPNTHMLFSFKKFLNTLIWFRGKIRHTTTTVGTECQSTHTEHSGHFITT